MKAFSAAIVTVLLALCATGAQAASGGHGGGHGGHDAHEEVPTGAELAERCEEYAESLAFSREQLKRRTILGRWDFVRSRHRERERFYDSYCRGDVHARGDGHHGDDDHGGDHDAGHGDADDDHHADGHG